jgi:nicotinamidase-related amidase
VQHSLIDVNDSVLIVIDVQERFLARLGTADHERLLNRVDWLIDVAVRLQVPLVVTAEYVARNGGIAPGVAARVPPGTIVFDKMVFDLSGQPDILDAVRATGRKTAVLVGMETDVCVAQSAIGLMQQGYRAVVVVDAVNSPGAAEHVAGLERVRLAGATLSSVKGLFYEWIRTVEATHSFTATYTSEIGEPAGIVM